MPPLSPQGSAEASQAQADQSPLNAFGEQAPLRCSGLLTGSFQPCVNTERRALTIASVQW